MADDSRIRQIRRHIKATDKDIQYFVATLNKYIGQNLNKILAGLDKGNVQAEEAARLLAQTTDILGESQFNDLLLEGIDEIYANDLQFIKDGFADLGKPDAFTQADQNTIEELVKFKPQAVSGKIADYLGDLKERTMLTVLSGERPNFRAEWDKLGGAMVNNLETELNTSVSAFNRTVTTNKAIELGFEQMIYIGPDDKIARDFCQKCLEGRLDGLKRDKPIYTLDEIRSMDNGTDLDVLTYGGGYNCRHHWDVVAPVL